MAMSWIIAGVALGAFLLAAAGAWLVGRKSPRHQRRSIHLKALLLVGCGIAFGIYAFWVDSSLRKTTLHEVIVEGPRPEEAAAGEAIRRVTFQVEHPGVEHELLICPLYPPPSAQRADFEVRLDATLTQGDSPLLSEEFTFAPRFDYRDADWHSEYLSFTPTAAGEHTLTLRILTAETPAVHVRVEDPLKTDGQRIPGY